MDFEGKMGITIIPRDLMIGSQVKDKGADSRIIFAIMINKCK